MMTAGVRTPHRLILLAALIAVTELPGLAREAATGTEGPGTCATAAFATCDPAAFRSSVASGVDSDTVAIRPGTRTFMEPAAPSPFSITTTIAFSVIEATHVRLTVYDARYEPVATLLDRNLDAGRHSVVFRPSSVETGLPSGMYFYELQTGSDRIVQRMMYIK